MRSPRKEWKVDRKGAAVVEFAVLLPVYVLLIIGMIYFSNVVLIWQEGTLAARFLASNSRRAPAPGGRPRALIANTGGAMVPEDYFIYGLIDPVIRTDRQSGAYAQKEIRDELIRASWRAGQTFDLSGDSRLDVSMTREGRVVYRGDPPAYAFDGDDALIAEELSDWFTRGSATVTMTYDSRYLRVGKWKLPPARVTAEGRVVQRLPTDKQRPLDRSQAGYRKPIEDLVSKFGASEAPAGTLPMPDYPGFMNSDGFWVPD